MGWLDRFPGRKRTDGPDALTSVQPGDHNSMLVLTNASTNFMYQAYVGRVTASSSNAVSVFAG